MTQVSKLSMVLQSYNDSTILEHSGKKGMKWGVRRLEKKMNRLDAQVAGKGKFGKQNAKALNSVKEQTARQKDINKNYKGTQAGVNKSIRNDINTTYSPALNARAQVIHEALKAGQRNANFNQRIAMAKAAGKMDKAAKLQNKQNAFKAYDALLQKRGNNIMTKTNKTVSDFNKETKKLTKAQNDFAK